MALVIAGRFAYEGLNIKQLKNTDDKIQRHGLDDVDVHFLSLGPEPTVPARNPE